ncbi:MAG: ATP synthase F0 subunit B [Candidatus Adiutrix sp.]|jgi:F-type H+-transporting ATPase subunit b|nr:ATP synthase F0 subunit B [Candidatus Adiutrix sp.]
MQRNSLKKIIALAVLPLWLTATAGSAFASGGYSEAQIHDLLFRIMNFVVFFGALFYLLHRPVAKFFRERRENIAKNLEYLETQARNLEEQNEIMNRQISGIASERDSILAQYERLGQKEAERIIAEAKKAAETIIQKTQAAMDLEVRAARQLLLREIVALSTQAATDLIRTNINDDDQKRLTAEFMAQVEKLKMANN